MDDNAKSTAPQGASEPRELTQKRTYLKEQEFQLKQRINEYTKTKLELYTEREAKLKAKDKDLTKYHKKNIKILRKKLKAITRLVVIKLNDVANSEHNLNQYFKNK